MAIEAVRKFVDVCEGRKRCGRGLVARDLGSEKGIACSLSQRQRHILSVPYLIGDNIDRSC